jgi:hypothetical protein
VSDTTNFGAQEELQSYGCVYFGEWDRSSDRCSLFIEIYGKDLFTEANARALRYGTFDLNHYRAKFIEACASDYITKPVDLDQLFSVLRVWLTRGTGLSRLESPRNVLTGAR